MPVPLIAAGIGAVGAIGGGLLANKGASKAAQATQQAADQSALVQRQIYGQNQAALAPWQQQGMVAGNALTGLLGLSGGDSAAGQNGFRNYIANSDYAFNLGNGSNAINSGYAGAGTVRSGAAMKGIESFRQGLQQGYRGEYMNALAGQQGLGFSAASAQAGVGQNYANSLSNIYQTQGNNAANAALLKAQNNGQMFNSLATIGAGVFGGGKW